jgi:hypothetical protein
VDKQMLLLVVRVNLQHKKDLGIDIFDEWHLRKKMLKLGK